MSQKRTELNFEGFQEEPIMTNHEKILVTLASLLFLIFFDFYITFGITIGVAIIISLFSKQYWKKKKQKI